MAGRTAEVNESVLLCKTLKDGSTGKGVRARVFNAAGTEVSGSPFTLTHRSGGHYSGTGWTPVAEGQYSVSYEVYTTSGFVTPDGDHAWSDAEVLVRSKIAPSYCRISTTLNSVAETQEVIAWLERLGVPLTATTNARIEVRSTEGTTLWEADLLSPNADGVFAFSTAFVPPDADRSYYIEITINDGTSDVSGRFAFITVG